MKYIVTITHDNRRQTLTMEFKHLQVKLACQADYKLSQEPTYETAKKGLEKMATASVTALAALGWKEYKKLTGETETTSEYRNTLMQRIKTKFPKGVIPTIIYKEV